MASMTASVGERLGAQGFQYRISGRNLNPLSNSLTGCIRE